MPPNAVRRVLIGGGTGFVGRALVARLLADGCEPLVVGRAASADLPAGVDYATWSAIESDGLPPGTDAVVNLAGRNIGDPLARWTESYRREVWTSRVHSTELLARCIQSRPAADRPKVFVTASAVGYYPVDASEECRSYDECSGGGECGYFQRMCAAWERAGRLDVPDVRHCVLRFGVVLGRSGGLVSSIYWPFYVGLGGNMAGGAHWFPWVHIDDATGIVRHALVDERATGVLNAVAPHTVRYRDFVQAFAAAMRRPALCSTPGMVVRWMFGDERARLVLGSQRVLPNRTLQSGYVFQSPCIDDACKRIVGT